MEEENKDQLIKNLQEQIVHLKQQNGLMKRDELQQKLLERLTQLEKKISLIVENGVKLNTDDIDYYKSLFKEE